MSTLDKAISIACGAHSGQVDKAGQPYILHPLKLMMMFTDNSERIVAILHDVVEDSDMSLDDLKDAGFSNEIVNAISCLSKKNNEPYIDFIMRIKKNNLARKIKIEDIKHNMDLTRLDSITEKDMARLGKYHNALSVLLDTQFN